MSQIRTRKPVTKIVIFSDGKLNLTKPNMAIDNAKQLPSPCHRACTYAKRHIALKERQQIRMLVRNIQQAA